MAKIKYGQIGTEHAHSNKISVYRNSNEYEIVGVAEPNAKLREKVKADPLYRDIPLMTVEQLLHTNGIQVVGVETAVRDQMQFARKVIDAGLHLHLEKPGGSSLPAMQKLLDDAAMKHCIVQLGYMYRYNPAVVEMRSLLSKGLLGDVFEIHAVMSKLSGQSLRDEMAEFKGGTMFELGCHLIDLVLGVLGSPNKIHPFPRHSANNDDSLQDNMLAVFEYPKATATIRTSVIEVDGFARRHFTVVGTKGTMHIQPLDNPTAMLTLLAPAGKYKKGATKSRSQSTCDTKGMPRTLQSAYDTRKILTLDTRTISMCFDQFCWQAKCQRHEILFGELCQVRASKVEAH